MNKKELLDWVVMEIGCREKCLEDARKNYNLKFLDPTPKLEKGIIALREIFKILSKEPEEEPVLDDAERRYLKNVIIPFKDKVRFIKKRCIDDGIYYIVIELFNLGMWDSIFLPYFKDETMYKNMELNKEYTLEDLEIKYDK